MEAVSSSTGEKSSKKGGVVKRKHGNIEERQEQQVKTQKKDNDNEDERLERLEAENATLTQSQLDLSSKYKSLKNTLHNLRAENEALKQSSGLTPTSSSGSGSGGSDFDKVRSLEVQLATLRGEKDNLVSVLHGLRGNIYQTSIVLERSHSRFSRLRDQLVATKDSLYSALEGSGGGGGGSGGKWGQDSQGNAMTLNELYRENEDLRTTITNIRDHLDSAVPLQRPASRSGASPSRSSSSPPPSLSLSRSYMNVDAEQLSYENKELKEKLRQTERKLRSAQSVRKRYEEALERANTIIDQNTNTPSLISSQRIDALEAKYNDLKQEYDKVSERERAALDECERVHGLCRELQGLLDTSTAAYTEKVAECDKHMRARLELEAHLDESVRKRAHLESELGYLRPNNNNNNNNNNNINDESEVQRYAEFARKLESQFRQSQQQSESLLYEKQKLEGQYRAIQSECTELRNTLARYESTNRDLRAQLSDREGRVQALESAKALLSNAMFKTDQENKQLTWQVRSLQGADERITKVMGQLHALQSQNIEQAQDLKKFQELAANARELKIERDELDEKLRAAQKMLAVWGEERSLLFGEINKMDGTCNELLELVQ